MFSILVLFIAFIFAIVALSALIGGRSVAEKVGFSLFFGFTAYLLVSYALLLGW